MEWYLYLHLFSIHFVKPLYYNNLNIGIGITNDRVAFGYYRNSYDRDSFYAAVLYKNFVLGVASGYDVKVGPKPPVEFQGFMPVVAYRYDFSSQYSILLSPGLLHFMVRF